MFILIIHFFKGTIHVISSGPLHAKMAMPDASYKQLAYAQVTFAEKLQMEINSCKKQKY